MTNKAQLDNYDEIIERLNDMFENNTDKVNYSTIVYAGFMSAFDRVVEEKNKYKRAFEIFTKDKELTLHKGKCPILGADEYKLSFVKLKYISRAEYELLEELIKNETENRN